MQLSSEHLAELNKMHSNKNTLLGYVGKLLDMEINAYVDKEIRPAYNLPKTQSNAADIHIDLKSGEIKRIE